MLQKPVTAERWQGEVTSLARSDLASSFARTLPALAFWRCGSLVRWAPVLACESALFCRGLSHFPCICPDV